MGISEQTKRVIEKAMQPRRKERYHKIEDFLDALGTENAQVVHEENEKVQSEETLYMSTAIKEDSEPQDVKRVQEKVSSKSLDVPKPKFLKEEDKEATMYITDYMVQESNIDTSDVVDLGLSVKWCGCNLGATKPEEYGSYYRWGDGMNGYTLDGSSSIVEISGTQYDAAYNLSGGKLRTPTRKEFKELIDRCRWSWTTYNGATGCKITGPSGKSIFLPSAGRKSDYGIYRKDTFGYYWSSSRAHHVNAYYLYFNEEDSDLTYEPIQTLRSIRPVYN